MQLLWMAMKARLRHPTFWLAVVALLLAAWLISRDAELFLDYARVLVWPVVVLLAILVFRVPLAGLFEDLVVKALKAGPLSAEFTPRAEQQGEEEFDLDEFVSEFAEDAGDEEEGYPRYLAISVMGLLNQAFQSQIDFLRFLRSAGEGLETAAAEKWLREYLQSRPGGAAPWDIPALLQWLVNQSLVAVTPEGRYGITPLGVHLAEAADGFWYAPKLA